MDQLCITYIKNFLNYDLVVVFANDHITGNNEVIHFEYPSPKLFSIPNNCTFFHLKEIVYSALGLSDQRTLMKLYYYNPQLTI